MSPFRRPAFLAVLLGHFAVDLLNSQTGVLLATLSGPLALTNADIGLTATLFGLSGAAAQPVFGWLSDRRPGRWAAAGAVIGMAGMFALFLGTPGRFALLFLILASICSAAFHPAGADLGARGGGAGPAMAGLASLFFLFGQIGLSIGPALSGYLIEHWGWMALYGPVIVVALVGVAGLTMIPSSRALAARPVTRTAAPPGPIVWRALLLAVLIGGLRVWAQTTVGNLGPKYFHDLGLSPSTYGAIVGVFMLGIALGGILGGWLADRIGGRAMTIATLALSVPALFWLPVVTGPAIYAVALLAGVLNGGPHSLLVVIAQRAMPGRGSLASGLALGSMFAISSSGVWLSGLVADQVGLGFAVQAGAGLDAAAALLALALPFASVARPTAGADSNL
ncbi:MAG: MFS transporter [Anaerolineales bacterium]|nr:MFS transporter [Anaerolineales bacterium]